MLSKKVGETRIGKSWQVCEHEPLRPRDPPRSRAGPLDAAGQRELLRCQLAALQCPVLSGVSKIEGTRQSGGSSAAMQAGVLAKLQSEAAPAASPQR